jgi:hypothetical protein
MLRLVLLLLAAAAGATAFQPLSVLQEDTWAIYSLLFTNTQTSHGPDNNPIYLIFDTTVPGMPPEPCVNPPADRKTNFAEVMADFGARKGEHTRLMGELKIAKPYRYVNGTEMRDKAILGQAPDFFSVGNVYFDRDHTVALTYLSSVCGGLCGKFTWRVFERNIDGHWEERSWVNCFGYS